MAKVLANDKFHWRRGYAKRFECARSFFAVYSKMIHAGGYQGIHVTDDFGNLVPVTLIGVSINNQGEH